MSATDPGLNRQAVKLYQAGHYREAEQLFRRLIEQDADNWQHPLLLGLCRRSQGDIDEAVRWVRRAVELGDGQPATHYYLGRLMTDAGQAGPAREQFGQAIALDPNHVEARTGMGLVSLMTGQLERAVTELKTALRANARHLHAMAALARALLELDRVDEAYQYAARAVKQEPENAVAQAVCGRVLLRQGYLDLAEQCFRNALELGLETGEVHAMLARVLVTRGRDADALTHWLKALEVDHGGAPVVIEASESLERVGDIPQARKLLKKAAARWPDDRGIALRLAELSLLDGAPAAATGVLDGLDADDPDVAVLRARIADATGDSGAALALLEPVVAADADSERRNARLLLARLRSDADPADADNAREPLAPLLDRAQPVPDAVIVWSTVCENAGDYDGASSALEALLERGVASETDRRVLHNRLGNCLDAADERARAWDNWKKGAWRGIPNLARLQAQREAGVLDLWLAGDWEAPAPVEFSDQRPAPLVIAGWPGAGREILLSALAGHPELVMLDPEGENRRLEALGWPTGPKRLLGATGEELLLGRKRFMRGVERGRGDYTVLDAGWWPATAIPALARYFPGTTVIVPAAEPEDLALQWRMDGYVDVDALVDDYRRELQLWQRVRGAFDLRVVDVGRGELLDDPGAVVDRVSDALGLTHDDGARATAERIRAAYRFAPEGSGARYRDVGS